MQLHSFFNRRVTQLMKAGSYFKSPQSSQTFNSSYTFPACLVILVRGVLLTSNTSKKCLTIDGGCPRIIYQHLILYKLQKIKENEIPVS